MATAAWLVLGVLVTGLVAMAGLQLVLGMQARAAAGRSVVELPALAGATRGTWLVYFSSPTCGPCRVMRPSIEALRAADRPVIDVDVSRDPQTAIALGVMATPTTLVVRDGRVTDVLLGVQTRERLEAALGA